MTRKESTCKVPGSDQAQLEQTPNKGTRLVAGENRQAASATVPTRMDPVAKSGDLRFHAAVGMPQVRPCQAQEADDASGADQGEAFGPVTDKPLSELKANEAHHGSPSRPVTM